jgi:hypothetical protein
VHSGCTYDLQHTVHGHITHSVSLIMSLSVTAAMCTTVTTGNSELTFKDEAYLFYVRLGAYRAVNTLHFGYKNQSLNVL